MKKLTAIATLLLPFMASAAEPISAADAGTYEVMARDGKAAGMFYRLSQSEGRWKMEGKESGGQWHSISCDQGCAYSEVPAAEAGSYLPAAMNARYEIACIKNVAQAFCRYSLKSDRKQGGYVVMALVTGQPTPIFLQRRAGS